MTRVPSSLMFLVTLALVIALLLTPVQSAQSPLAAAAAADSTTRQYHSAASRGTQTAAFQPPAPSNSIHRGHRKASTDPAAPTFSSSPPSPVDSYWPTRRLLQVSENAPLVIPFSTANQSAGNGEEYLSAVSFVFNHLSTSTSSFILFPYAFQLNSTTPSDYPQGAFISTTQLQSVNSDLPSRRDSNTFEYAVSVTSQLVSAAGTSQSQAVYDSSIAIFISYGILPSDPSQAVRLLTNEAPNVCQSLYGSISGKWAQCWDAAAWLSYLQTSRNPEATSIVYVQAADIASGILLDNGLPRFGSLIFADIYLGSADVILSNITQAAVEGVQAFVAAGGTVISSGKGAVIVQELGLITSQADGSSLTTVFSSDTELVALSGYTSVATTGCEQEANSVLLSDLDFTTRTLCFSLGTGQAGSITTALVSSPPVDLTALQQTSLHTIATYNTAKSPLLIRTAAGLSTAVSSSATTPMLLYGQSGKGQLVINLGNAPVSAASYPWIYNMLFLSNSRPVLLQASFSANSPDIIPALEQVSVSVQLDVANLYNDALQDVRLLIWPADGVSVIDSPVECLVVTNVSSADVPASSLNSSSVLDCSPSSASLTPLSSSTASFTVFIENVDITQRGTGIVLLVAQLTYAAPSGKMESVLAPMTVTAYTAAQVVGDYNADPMGFYPLPGSGQFIDNVLTAENKQGTTAFNFKHTAIVPLITPLVDISLQSSVARYLDFDALYYEAASNGVEGYVYPFVLPAGGDYSATIPAPNDFLDYVLLNLRGNSLAANWDEPIFSTKLARNSTFPSYPPLADTSVANISLAQYDVSNNNAYVVVKQTAFGDAQNYFTYPSPRLMAFLDTSQPQPFRTFNTSTSWPGGAASGGFPSWMMNPSGTALRQQLAFGSNTIYFYGSAPGEYTYPLPAGVTSTDSVLTLDRYNGSTTAECTEGVFSGSRSKRSVQGYYNSNDDNMSPAGMLANEYTNGVLAWCNHQGANQVDLTALTELSNGSSSLTHYVVPLSSNADITSGDDVMFMRTDPAAPSEWYYAPSFLTGIARYGDYPELRIKYVYTASLALADAISFRGGVLSFSLPTACTFAQDVDPIASEYITWSADEVAFVGTTYSASSQSVSSQFYRGELPDENSGAPSQLQVFIEGLTCTAGASSTSTTFNSAVSLQELIYDLTAPPTFQTFQPVPSFTTTLAFTQQLSLILPAVRLEFEYSRTPDPVTPLSPSPLLNPIAGDTGNVSYLLAYEDDQPFVRYGVYTQELMAHRTVYGSQQFNPVSDTGMVTVNGGFSYITTIGESSIPYRQYLSTGAGQLIPGTFTTGRMSWEDLWSRQLVEPIRSLFVDAAPLPGPLRNFQMTTTFELLDPSTGERSLDWHSDDAQTIHVQMKLLNNYQKWWCLTTSKQNELIFTAGLDYPGTDFVVPSDTYANQIEASVATSASDYLQYGYGDFYGVSLDSGTVWLSGVQLSGTQLSEVGNAFYCVSNYSAACDFIGKLPIPSVQPSSATVNPPNTWWNYASSVESYWPQGYISTEMWALNVSSYDDNVFDYGYNYQFDNRLPSVDTGLLKPQNIVSYPIFAGVGYACSYSSSLSSDNNFPGVQGWWSDQLQNKDDTVLAGQATSHTVAVGQPDLTLSNGWIDIASLTAATNASAASLQSTVDSALTNIYTCLFNRHRIVTQASSPLVHNPANVVQNNVVPVDPTLLTHDPRYTDYPCDADNGVQYTTESISSYDNYLETETINNYLYFAANLRGGAKENINVLYSLNPINGVQQEGITTVQEGGEFVYWNPSLGPNAFETVDDPVSNVNAIRTDLTLTEVVYPAVATTFESTIFQLLTLSDPAEINNKWTQTDCDQQYGFGDSSVRTFTGGNYGSENVVLPGGTTYVEVDFFNNAGFDWNLLAGAILSESLTQASWSATDLQSDFAPVVQGPTAYNFMSVQPSADLAPYLTIVPSLYNAYVAPLEFDFTSNNVATIRDGFQGSYFYKVTVSDDLPVELMGRMYSIPIALNQTWFQQLPGYNDPTGVHNYTLSIPPITIGFPYPANTTWAGGAYYVNGFATNLTFSHLLDTQFQAVGAKTVNAQDILALELLTEQSTAPSQLTAFWTSLNNSWNMAVPFSLVNLTGGLTSVQFDFTAISPSGLFPIPLSPPLGPDTAEVYILLNAYAPELQPVYPNRVSQDSSVTFQDWKNVTKGADVGYELSVYAEGPYLQVTYAITLLDATTLQPLAEQQLHCGDSGALQLLLTVQNIGNAFAYDVSMAANLTNVFINATLAQPLNYGVNISSLQLNGSSVIVNVSTTEVVEAGGALAAVVLLSYALPRSTNGPCNTSVVFSEGAQCDFAFFPDGELSVHQQLNSLYAVAVSQTPRLAAYLNASQVAANSSQLEVFVSAPNIPLSSVLAYLNTSAYPSVGSSNWAFAYQVRGVVVKLNQYGNGTITETVNFATFFVTSQTSSNGTSYSNTSISLPVGWQSATVYAVIGVSAALSTSASSPGVNTDPAATFVPAQTSNSVILQQPSSSSSHTALIEETVIPIVLGLLLIALIVLLCIPAAVRYSRRGGKDGVIKSERPSSLQMQTLNTQPAEWPLPARGLPITRPMYAAYVPEAEVAKESVSNGPTMLMTGVNGVHVVDLNAADMAQRRSINERASASLKGSPSPPPLPAREPVAVRLSQSPPPPLPASRPSLTVSAPLPVPPPLPTIPPRSSGESYMDTNEQYEGERIV